MNMMDGPFANNPFATPVEDYGKSDDKLDKPKLVTAIDELKNQNDYSEDIIASIKTKVTSLLEWRESNTIPMKPSIPDASINSAIGELENQVGRYRTSNLKLTEILEHLRHIV